jgi:hypothetical protein
MRSERAILVGALLAAALTAGCGASTGRAPRGDGGSEDTGGSNGGGSVGTGGFAAGGAGGAAGGSSGGASGSTGGTGGGFPDAGAAGGGGGTPGGADAGASDGSVGPLPPPPQPTPTCEVTIRAVRPLTFDGLPAGPTSRLRVEAVATGPTAPRTPAWQWTVRHQNSGASIPTTSVEMDPAVVEFPLASPGNYLITALATPTCKKDVTATATDHPVSRFWLRVIPGTSDDQPIEGATVDVPAGESVTRDLACGIGTLVSIDPRDATMLQSAVFSYVRITAPGSTVRFEGHTRTGAFSARLDPALSYDVLVIPDNDVVIPDKVIAPLLFNGSPSSIAQNQFVLDAGVTVAGQVTSSKGPVTGARVLLRDGIVPSTTGVTQANGQFDLRVRTGNRFAAVVIPPLHSGLPEARLPAGSGLAIYDFPPGARVLDFAWDPIATTDLDLTITDSAGAAVKSQVRVRLTSAEGAFAEVGTMTLKVVSAVQPEQRFNYRAGGVVQQDRASDARGAVSFTDVPRGMYNATLSPIDGSAAITTVPINLTAAMGRVALSPRLARKVSLSGKLLPIKTTAGATVLALDTDADPALPPPSALVDGNGNYVLHVDPGRSYALVMEANPARGLPRTFLRSILAPAKDSVREDLTIPGGLSVSGVVTGARGPVSGALVQAYCIGQPPSCIDPHAPDITTVRPTAEAISDGSGAYRLLVPDPAIPN